MGIDFDHFKAVNDRWGQHARDPMLREAVAIAYATLRSTDALGRTGGDEFLVVVPDAAMPEAHALAEPVRAAIAARTVTLAAAHGREVMHAQTASIGVATPSAAANNVRGPLGATGATPSRGASKPEFQPLPGSGPGPFPERTVRRDWDKARLLLEQALRA